MRTGTWLSLIAGALLVAGVAAGSLAVGCSSDAKPAGVVPDAGLDVLMDPRRCAECHQTHYDDWSVSMHAYASDDPVFVAMNQRGQRETDGGLGDFCIKCHAPMALRAGKTTNGLNLASLDQQYKGVTCFFCHSIASFDSAHPYNAGVTLSDDLTMRGEIADPAANTTHKSAYSLLHVGESPASGNMCGPCHDIVNPKGTPIERTFAEWHASPFNSPEIDGGQSCTLCHMKPVGNFQAIAKDGPKNRRLHAHDFPAVDVPLDPNFAGAATDRATVQNALDGASIQGALCVGPTRGAIRVTLDPFGVGHSWPSGAAQDRRVWAEVKAFKAGQLIYSSGDVPAGTPVGSETEQFPADLWVLRDQMYDEQCKPVDMFWQAKHTTGNELPPISTFDQTAPAFFNNHFQRRFPKNGRPLLDTPGVMQVPDRVTLRVRVQSVGLDVIGNLADSGDLDAGVADAIPIFDVSLLGPGGAHTLEWTLDAARDSGVLQVPDTTSGEPGDQIFCVGTPAFTAFSFVLARDPDACAP